MLFRALFLYEPAPKCERVVWILYWVKGIGNSTHCRRLAEVFLAEHCTRVSQPTAKPPMSSWFSPIRHLSLGLVEVWGGPEHIAIIQYILGKWRNPCLCGILSHYFYLDSLLTLELSWPIQHRVFPSSYASLCIWKCTSAILPFYLCHWHTVLDL